MNVTPAHHSPEARELLVELRRLGACLSVPHPSWHPFVSEIAACRDDYEQALALAERQPQVLVRLLALIESEGGPPAAADASPDLVEAWQRFHELPRPSMQHPHLDEILPAVEALQLLLAALGDADEDEQLDFRPSG